MTHRPRLPAFLRYLRVAFSVGCGILCLLLIALWVRSYWWTDTVHGRLSETRPFMLKSEQGQAMITVSRVSPGRAGNWSMFSYRYGRTIQGTPPTGGTTAAPSTRSLHMPYWFLVLAMAAFTYYSSRNPAWQFSLRTLLVATTVIALLLGGSVWLIK